ncbi:MAG: ribonuclease HII [Nitrospirae bacterium]|nr:ribonuclease HII [Nitrospirota bacterium]
MRLITSKRLPAKEAAFFSLDLGQLTAGAVICGCDEAGRGSGAAEVYVGAVILRPDRPIPGLADSKKISALKRESLSEEIKQHALSWSIATASVDEIEKLNILGATLMAMKRAVEGLEIRPDRTLVDGNHAPRLGMPVQAIVRGDETVPVISAASILAKVARDRAMARYHIEYPQYGFDVHKGYLTKRHTEALRKYGPCLIHRRTYAPVRELLSRDDKRQGSLL